MRALSRSCADKERENCYGLYAKKLLIIPTAIRAVYSRDNIFLVVNKCCGREEMGVAALRQLCMGVVVKSEMHYV